ncbi:hypothetical protein LTS10_001030 [Elasticomyces elasticus]|nr:hypothetical protein LTS10_001030 [Elasticomyces elasticus]
MSLTAALSELGVASHDAIQHPIQDSTGEPIQVEIADMSSTQSADNVNEPLTETHTGPPAVVFKCAPCHLQFITEKRLQNHVRYSPAHSTGSGSATTGKENANFKNTQGPKFHFTAYKGVNRTSPTHATQPESPMTAEPFGMRPALHDEVSRLLEAHNLLWEFVELDDSEGSLEEYVTSIKGTFTCTNARCCSPQTWTSWKVALTIREFSDARYNARVYYQRCRCCKSVCEPELDGTYADRIAYRLKKWSGIAMDPPPHSNPTPHAAHLCEGCRAGYCNHTEDFEPNFPVVTSAQMNRVPGRRQHESG